MAGEYFRDDLDSMVEAFRQWYRIPTQVVTIGEKRYVFVALKSDKDEDTVKYFFTENWREAKGLMLFLFTASDCD